MDLKQLQYFVVCAQTGSFSDAAKVLYSTQPSVSKVVKALEDALGMQLFERLYIGQYHHERENRRRADIEYRRNPARSKGGKIEQHYGHNSPCRRGYKPGCRRPQPAEGEGNIFALAEAAQHF